MTGLKKTHSLFLSLFLFVILGSWRVKTVWADEETLSGMVEPAAVVEVELFNNFNVAKVFNRPTHPTIFKLTKSYQITLITTYHWNNGLGKPPGTIGLKKRGVVVGAWQATSRPGAGGAPDAFWDVTPNIILGQGTYRIITNHWASWSQNDESGNRGMSLVKGVRVRRRQ